MSSSVGTRQRSPRPQRLYSKPNTEVQSRRKGQIMDCSPAGSGARGHPQGNHTWNNLSAPVPAEGGEDSDEDNTTRSLLHGGYNRPQFDPEMEKGLEFVQQLIQAHCEQQQDGGQRVKSGKSSPPQSNHTSSGSEEGRVYAENLQIGDRNVMLLCQPKETKQQKCHQQIGDRNIMINLQILMSGCQMVTEDNTIVQIDSEGEVWLEIRRKPKPKTDTGTQATPSLNNQDHAPGAANHERSLRARSGDEHWDSTEVVNHDYAFIKETSDRMSLRMSSNRSTKPGPVENTDSTLLDDVLANERVRRFLTDDRNSYDFTCYDWEYENQELYANIQRLSPAEEQEPNNPYYCVVTDLKRDVHSKAPDGPTSGAPPVPERDLPPRRTSDNARTGLHRPPLPIPRRSPEPIQHSHVEPTNAPPVSVISTHPAEEGSAVWSTKAVVSGPDFLAPETPLLPPRLPRSRSPSPSPTSTIPLPPRSQRLCPSPSNERAISPAAGVVSPSLPRREPYKQCRMVQAMEHHEPMGTNGNLPHIALIDSMSLEESSCGYQQGRVSGSLHGQPWYHCNIDRTTSIVRLEREGKEGAFIVRDSSCKTDHAFSLDVFFQNKIDRLKICGSSGHSGFYLDGSDNRRFPSLPQLIDAILKKGLDLMDRNGRWQTVRMTPLDSARFRGNQ